MDQNKWRYNKNNPYLVQSETLFESWKDNGKLTPIIQTLVHKSNIYYFKIWKNDNINNEIERIYDFLCKGRDIRTPRHLPQLSIWRCGLGILDMDTQLNSLKTKWIYRLQIPPMLSGKISCMLYQLNLILNSNQGLALLRQKQILGYNGHKNC